jgi:hypothetical protein
MANEGIMAAPLPMQKKEPPQGYVSSLDAYNAASSAMQETDPQAFNEYKSAIGQSLGGLDLKPSEIEAFVTLLEYMLQYPEQYEEIIRQGIEAGAIEEGDFPAQFDPNFISTMLAAVNEQRIQRAQNVAPEAMAPGPQEPMAMKNGGLADAAEVLQARGRGGDTMLAHINPQEAEMLRRAGGLGTINPYTGLPEYFSLKSVWKAVTAPVKAVVNVVKEVAASPVGRIALTVGATMLLGPAGAGFSIGTAGAIASGGITALGGGNLQDVLKGAALGYVGSTIAPSVGSYLPGAAGSVLNQGLTAGVLGTGFGLASGMSLKNAIKTGAVSGLTGAGVAYGQQQGYFPKSTATSPQRPEDVPVVERSIPEGGTGPVQAVGTAADQPGANVSTAGIPPPANVTPTNIPPGINSAYASDVDAMALPNRLPLTNVAPQDFQAEYLRSRGISPDSVSPTSVGPSPSNVAIERDILGMTGPVDTARQTFADPMEMGGRGIDAVKTGYKEYLSPNRPSVQAENQKAILEGSRARADYVRTARAEGLTPTTAEANAAYEAAYSASKPGIFSRYMPLAAAGLGVTAASGGFKRDPGTQAPAFERNYTGQDYMRDNPSQFSGRLYNYQSPGAQAYNPYRETYYSGTQGADASGVVTPTGIMQAEYSPYYGRRAQRRQQYYSPFLGTEEPVMAAKGGMITAEPMYYGFGGDVSRSVIDAVRAVKPQPQIANTGAPQAQPVVQSGNYSSTAYMPEPSAPAPQSSMPPPVLPIQQLYDPYRAMQQLYNPYRETTYSGAQGVVSPGVVLPTGILQAQYSPNYGRRRMRPVRAADGGSITEFPRKSGPINGPGTGTSDDIPAMLSDGEFVFTAKAVRNAGAGSRRKGAARMYKLMKSLEKGGMVKG